MKNFAQKDERSPTLKMHGSKKAHPPIQNFDGLGDFFLP